ncbi:hypothetical protein NDA11_007373 [Ustilago hordei]|uniref:pH-response regulator protein palC n=1 Tax=Ustilago hordei TaxID=120017 RepID=I2FVL5_USTHO|nr:uncharacterized protein UHO2_04496 [Ustilago hordei]KAJ1578120.1 hypothetical protein NDA12_005354 [Ustilago hordei]KAJ1578457.1 hypothetical protein NDA11_007373 [Ustilago hordei]KAJ1592438.1 hypothetical protein NDA15_002255 [Ustilago hordei]UTT89874.1 hypothetical protein NDA17_004164 [Ustilago hordei]CCF50958.1 uncharacterized protein UHOR_06863 [Ustilago hordei]
MYIYDLATTGRISFSDFLVTTDLVSQVSQTTQLRARLGAVLKENRAATSILFSSSATSSSQSECKDGAVGNTDWLSIIKRIEEYLPHLLGVFNSVQTDDLLLRYEPVFSWRTWISCSRLGGAGRMQLPGLYYELASTLLTYSLTLSNLAASAVDGLGSFETNRSLSWQQRKDKDDKLRWAADTLCRASGILLLLSTELLPKWKVSVGSVEVLPPDLTQEATLALSKVCLAEAQALAIRKLVSPSLASSVDRVTPGPPLQKGHPSASLLAKLHLSVVEEMEASLALMRTVRERGRSKAKKAGVGGRKAAGAGGGGEAGLSANYEHELSSRISETNDAIARMGLGDAEEGGAGGGGGGGGVGKRKLFGKFKLGHKGKNDAPSPSPSPSPSPAGGGGRGGAGGGGAGFYSAPSTTTSSNSELEITSSLLKYLSFSSQFHRAIAYKWLGIDAAESSNKIGTAITLLSLSTSILSSATLRNLTSSLCNISISSSTLLPTKKRGKTGDRGVVDQELATVEHWLQSYKKLNDTVSFQPIPPAAEVQAKVPAGRAALLVKKYSLPSPEWGPGSQGYRGRGGEGLSREEMHLLGDQHPARRNLVGMDGGGSGEATSGDGGGGRVAYAGQGAYY